MISIPYLEEECKYKFSICETGRKGCVSRIAQSELMVITKAKGLCGYVLTVTEKSPKRFRFTLVSQMQKLALDITEQASGQTRCTRWIRWTGW